MKLLLAAILVSLLVLPARAVEPVVAGGVDTTGAEVRTVLELWKNYLGSRPDQIWRDSEWNAEKRRFWSDYDLTAPYVYRFDPNDLPADRKPVVLAIDRDGDLYSIRTLFFRDIPGGDPMPWAIVRVYAHRVDGRWKLRNALGVLTDGWNRPSIGRITFMTPPGHRFDVELARRSVAFCDSVAAASGSPDWQPFRFFIADSREQADRILGIEFHDGGAPEGRVLRYHDILTVGSGREWFPDGFVQMVVPSSR